MTTRFSRLALIALLVALAVVQGRATQEKSGAKGTDVENSGKGASSKKPLTLDGIKGMLQAGLSEDLIIAKIRQGGHAFDLGPEEMVELKKMGCSEAIMRVMLDPTVEPKAGTPKASPGVGSESKEPAEASANLKHPEEVGVYAMLEGKLIEMQPEIVTWQSGGVLKSMATAGLTKGHVNGKIMSPNSPLKLFPPLEFLIRSPEGVSAAEYQLLRLDEKSNRREFRSMTGGIIHSSGGAEKNAVAFTFDKVAARTFRIKLSELKQGEYGILPPGATTSANVASSGKMYTFRIPE
jgi:hypothetical protein